MTLYKFKQNQWVECVSARFTNIKKGDILKIRKIEKRIEPYLGDLSFYNQPTNFWYRPKNFKPAKNPIEFLKTVSRLEIVD